MTPRKTDESELHKMRTAELQFGRGNDAAETAAGRVHVGRGSTRFTAAAAMTPRKTRGLQRDVVERGSFNSAAAMTPRKTGRARPSPSSKQELQFGRGNDAAENFLSIAAPGFQTWASIRPRQ